MTFSGEPWLVEENIGMAPKNMKDIPKAITSSPEVADPLGTMLSTPIRTTNPQTGKVITMNFFMFSMGNTAL